MSFTGRRRTSKPRDQKVYYLIGERKKYPGCAGSMQSAGIGGDIRHFWTDNSNHQSEKAEMGQGHWAVTEGL